MISIQTLRSFVNERLSAAAEEICMVVQRIITDYENEALCSKQHIEKQGRILYKGSKARIKLHRADIPEQQQRIVKMFEEESNDDDGGGGDDDDDEDVPGLFDEESDDDGDDDDDEDSPGFPASDSPLPPVFKEESPEEQEWSSSVVQEEPESPQIKEKFKPVADWSTLSLTSLDRKSRGDILLGISEQRQLIIKIFEEESDDNDDDFPGFPASEVSSEQQERSPNLVQEEPESPRVKEEPEELVLTPEMADVSTLTTLVDRKPHQDTLSAVTNLPDAVSTATTSGPCWPTDMTPAEPEQQLDMCSVSAIDRMHSLADCLVGLRTLPTLNTQQANAIIALWQNLLPMPYESKYQRQVAYPPLACTAQHQCLSMHFRPIKPKGLVIPDMGTGSHAQWPDCCHLVESILVKLSDIHKNPNYHACYTLRWTPVLREYDKIRQLVLGNRTVMQSTNLQLFGVDQATFIDWHVKRMQGQDCNILLQGVKLPASECSILVQGVNLPASVPVAPAPLPPVQVHPTAAPPQPGRQNRYHSPQNTAEQAMDTSESAALVEHPHPSQSNSPTLTAEMQLSPQQSPPSTSGPWPVFMIPQIPAAKAISPAAPRRPNNDRTERQYTCKKCSQPCKKETGHKNWPLGSVYCPQKAGVPLDQWKEEVCWRKLKLKLKNKNKK